MQLLIAVLSLDVTGLVLHRFIPVCFFFFFFFLETKGSHFLLLTQDSGMM